MPKALVTGASGFIGPHIIEACLKEGWEVLGVDIKEYPEHTTAAELGDERFEFRKMDCRELTLEDMQGVDYVFSMAFVTNIPYSVEHPLETTHDNLEMTVHMMDISAKAGVKKFCYPSTASQYGNNPTPWTEDMPPNPIEPYSWQKLSCEFAGKMWAVRYGLPTVNFRLFQVFGENQRHDTAFAAFFRAKKEGRPITLTETTAQSSFRTGQRDFVYVKDIARAFVLAAVSDKVGKGEIINLGTGRVNTMEEVANAIGGEIIFIPKRHYEVERHEADITRARELLGWEPTVEVLPWLEEFVKTL